MKSEKWVEITAPTSDEAIILALARLGITREEAIIEMLDEGSPGFLGLGARDARVRVERRPAPSGEVVEPSPPASVAPEPPEPVVTETSAPTPAVVSQPEPLSLGQNASNLRRPRPSVAQPAPRGGADWNPEQVEQVLKDLRAHNVDMVTLGQYLQPTPHHHPVLRFWTPEEFEQLAKLGYRLGFTHVASGPLVRSSYHADLMAEESGLIG